jgi:hypothetical protein
MKHFIAAGIKSGGRAHAQRHYCKYAGQSKKTESRGESGESNKRWAKKILQRFSNLCIGFIVLPLAGAVVETQNSLSLKAPHTSPRLN